MLNPGRDLQHNAIKALEASGIGTWRWDVSTGIFYTDTIAQQLLDLKEASVHYSHIFTPASVEDKLHIDTTFETALISGKLNLKITGIKVQLHIKGGKVKDSSGAEIFYGTVQTSNVEDSGLLGLQKDLQESIEQSPIAIGLYMGRDLVINIANSVLLSFWGKTGAVIGQKLEIAVPELEGQPFLKILDDVFTTGQAYQITDGAADLAVDGVFGTYYFDFTYKPLFDAAGNVYAILNTAINVTEKVLSKRKMQIADQRFRAITEQSPVAIGLLYGKDMLVEIANDRVLEIWGRDKSIIGLPLRKVLPEIEGQGFFELLENVYTTGIPFHGNDILAKLIQNGNLKNVYIDFTYAPLKDEDGNTSGIMILANDVTEKVKTIREIAASEEKFRSLIYSAQTAVAVFNGRNLVADIANDAFLEFIGRNEDQFIGKPLLKAMPELDGQDSIGLMLRVFDEGIKVHHYGRQVNIVRNGELTVNFYNVSYTPLFDATGSVYAVLDIAIDVTETIKAQQAAEQAQASLKSAVELANLATWTLNTDTLELTYSDRMLDWFGLTSSADDVQYVIDCVHIDDRQRIQTSLFYALQPESDGIYDEEYTVVSRITGRERILHAQGRAYFNADGKPYMFNGTAQDITAQKQIQLALENEVKERTYELQRANSELENANTSLVNSNEELAQYAYVASHDLQEPLRKISMFSNLLKDKDVDYRHGGTIDKIIASSQRMSLLIKDLLEFSRLLNPDTRFVTTNLNTIIKAITNDFELLIEEKSADVTVENLPEIDAIPLQMNQLFYNLLGNALKFVPENVKPEIKITCKVLTTSEVEKHISNHNNDEYYQISISDNGIGIDPQYQKQIFEVFKRLHTRTEYSGSGIGLAICRRIAGNHSGAIYAVSEQGRGTTFNIILPKHQR
jgi:PAS domain S-box-containing protein